VGLPFLTVHIATDIRDFDRAFRQSAATVADRIGRLCGAVVVAMRRGALNGLKAASDSAQVVSRLDRAPDFRQIGPTIERSRRRLGEAQTFHDRLAQPADAGHGPFKRAALAQRDCHEGVP
jgi:hypothetical protein